MKEPDKGRITGLLKRVNEGDESAQEELIDLIYLELHQMARRIIFEEGRADPTFQTTELVNEAYIKLVDKENQNWKNRKHFFGAAARAMRRVLCAIARNLNAIKRGGKNKKRVPFEEWILKYEEEVGKLSDFNSAIQKLYENDRSWGEIVDLRYFGGLTMEEIAEVIGKTIGEVNYKWDVARAWLIRELKDYNPYDR